MKSLRDEFLYAQSKSVGPAVADDLVTTRIAELLTSQANSWTHAYEVQRLLVYLKLTDKLAIDVERRVAEAEVLNIPAAAKYRSQLQALASATNLASSNADAAALAAAPLGQDQQQRQAVATQSRAIADTLIATTDNQRREILAAVVDDLQWFYQKRNIVRTALNDSAVNLMRFGYWTMLVAASPFIFFILERHGVTTFFSKSLEDLPNYGLFTAASFGLVGSFFSRLISLNFSRTYSVEEAENLFSSRSLAIRSCVGVSGAIIVYFLLHSAAIGLAAPDFTKLSFVQREVHTLLGDHKVLLPSKDWALLIIWSILAGFSEQLVPDSLTKAQAQVTSPK